MPVKKNGAKTRRKGRKFMFCTRCGAQNPDKGNFCKVCGNVLRQPTPAAARPVSGPQSNPGPSSAPKQDVQSAIKGVASSPVFLIGTICFSLAILLSFIYSVSSATYGMNNISSLLSSMNIYGEDLSGALAASQSSMLFTAFISLIPTVLIAIGLWYTYVSGLKKDGSRFSTLGLKIIKVINIILIVLLSIAILLCIALFVFATALSERYLDPDQSAVLAAVTGVTIVIMLLIIVFYLVYQILAARSLGNVIRSANTDTPSDKVSVFVAVVCFIGAAFGAISALTNILNPVGMLSSAAGAGANICFGIVIFNYRTKMRELIAAGANPAYTQSSPAAPQNIQQNSTPAVNFSFAADEKPAENVSASPAETPAEPAVPTEAPAETPTEEPEEKPAEKAENNTENAVIDENSDSE